MFGRSKKITYLCNVKSNQWCKDRWNYIQPFLYPHIRKNRCSHAVSGAGKPSGGLN